MDIKKIQEKNPGFEFSEKATVAAKASQAVLDNSLTSKLTLSQYNLKYSDKASFVKSSATDSGPIDKGWKSLLKINTNRSNMDGFENPKISFFNEEGEEMIAED
jgi:hypothetical protein